ncbi:MAG: hypothetical protein Q7S01_04935 [bacterium]|nr:hypothetical protein [bacterium]
MQQQKAILLFTFSIIIASVLSSPTPANAANLLFRSGFEGSVTMGAINNCYGTGCHQPIVGSDNVTGYSWLASVWGGTSDFHLLVDAPVTASTVGNYMSNQIQTVTGHNGTQTRALYNSITQSGCCGTNSQGGGSTQNPYELHPAKEAGDLYISYWLKLQPDLVQKMTPQTWRPIFEWKTAGDYRLIAQIVTYGNVAPWWQIIGDNNANGGLAYQRFWEVDNKTVAVPVGQWFKFEVFWHRSSGSDGRVWLAVNGNVIADHYGPNIGVKNAPINRIFMPNLYSGGSYPIYQWIDDVEIWDGFPQGAGSIPSPTISPAPAPAGQATKSADSGQATKSADSGQATKSADSGQATKSADSPATTSDPAPEPTTVATAEPAPLAVSAPTPVAYVYSIGTRVKTSSRLKIRATASNDRGANVLCVQRKGSPGVIIAGPAMSDGYTWWKVNFDSGCDGWAVQTYLSLTALSAVMTRKKVL